ncbi:alkaline phosphatase [Xanthomonas translucens]|uniref:Alkaline phosphatase n=3 Tax=Xanthomonas campestris pv. translucens TaxID=343 RepID=A0A1C3TQ82_XANCT|nr:alkaline phosphatase [Xanthomonas translucens]KTF40761.1 alkaline phosphatase [Xanthomonas translucens pv. translucens]KWV11952.1 alkaline phosphatase [Xanthomonas translucens]MCC8447551.1 alkaline phosphatase [Xanthomonas translucens pv. translucens]MCS3359018.1 alkaline phosphatase [Xanthomonas translucens pv. translucens]MCS3372431.1 alkaline phosphatase [Xanthomonas translucens pv. translucens]
MRYLVPAFAAASTLLLAACASAPRAPAGAASAPIVVPAVAHPGGETPDWWYRSGAAKAANNGAMRGKAKNVILFLGDGMSLTTVAAARILDGQRKGASGEENQLSWEAFPATALSKTYNTDSQTPDSAGTMTSITTGVKTHMGGIGVSSGKREACADSLGKRLLTWLELADSAGLNTGIVTTTRLTHATPAATYAHTPERNWESDTDLPEKAVAEGCRDIAQQMVSAHYGRGPQVMLAGGRSQFTTVEQRDPEYDDKVGLRLDGRDLIGEWRQRHPQGAYVWNRGQLEAAQNAPALLGLFEPDHMQFDHDRDHGAAGDPSLAEMTRAAIRTLSRGKDGYVLMVEGGRIDHAHHAGNAYRALDETIALSQAVRAAAEATSAEDTLIIVTADHSHTLNFVGYPQRGNPILGKVRGTSGEDANTGELALDGNGQPYATLSYANGPGYTGASNQQPAGAKQFPHAPSSFEPVKGRPDLTHVDTERPDFMQEALVPTKAETHGGDDVGIWARGPGSDAFRGSLEENVIYHVIVQATPKLRGRLCQAGTCNGDGVPVQLPKPDAFVAEAASATAK